jgi:hypothetical protein
MDHSHIRHVSRDHQCLSLYLENASKPGSFATAEMTRSTEQGVQKLIDSDIAVLYDMKFRLLELCRATGRDTGESSV